MKLSELSCPTLSSSTQLTFSQPVSLRSLLILSSNFLVGIPTGRFHQRFPIKFYTHLSRDLHVQSIETWPDCPNNTTSGKYIFKTKLGTFHARYNMFPVRLVSAPCSRADSDLLRTDDIVKCTYCLHAYQALWTVNPFKHFGKTSLTVRRPITRPLPTHNSTT
jgi:hypothetical protein